MEMVLLTHKITLEGQSSLVAVVSSDGREWSAAQLLQARTSGTKFAVGSGPVTDSEQLESLPERE